MTKEIDWLAAPHQQFPMLLGDDRSATVAAWRWIEAGYTVRVLRGRKMRTAQGTLDETAAALQFPYYFGENGAALSECLSDLSWLSPGRGFVLLLQGAVSVLDAEPEKSLRDLVKILTDSALEWADTKTKFGSPTPFIVVLHASSKLAKSCSDRWVSAGASLGPVWAPPE